MSINIIRPTPKPITDEILAKHTFTIDEKLDLGQQLARARQQSSLIEDEKKQIMSNYKSKLDELDRGRAETELKRTGRK